MINTSTLRSSVSFCRIKREHRRTNLAISAFSCQTDEMSGPWLVGAVERHLENCPSIECFVGVSVNRFNFPSCHTAPHLPPVDWEKLHYSWQLPVLERGAMWASTAQRSYSAWIASFIQSDPRFLQSAGTHRYALRPQSRQHFFLSHFCRRSHAQPRPQRHGQAELTQVNQDTTSTANAQAISCSQCNADHVPEAGFGVLGFFAATIAADTRNHEHGFDGHHLHSSHVQDSGCYRAVRHLDFNLAMSLDQARSMKNSQPQRLALYSMQNRPGMPFRLGTYSLPIRHQSASNAQPIFGSPSEFSGVEPLW